jgi:hypothetical protein
VRVLSLLTLSSMILASLAASASLPQATAAPPAPPVVLVLVDGLSWEEAEEESGLKEAFQDGAAATLSTAQGTETPDDLRFGYVFLGAGSRVDTGFLPEELPADPGQIPGAFDGPASTVHPGSLGDALERAGVLAASVGDRALLVAMDSEGDVPLRYGGGDPPGDLNAALNNDAGFVAVDAADSLQAAGLVEAARRSGAIVAVVSPNGPPETPKLTPFALVQPGTEGGLLYSSTTRTTGLLANADVAPTLLAILGVPVPPKMGGRAAEMRPGQAQSAELLQRRIWFVEEDGFRVWAVVGVVCVVALMVGVLHGGRRGASAVVLALAALPAGALLAAAVPVTNVMLVAALTALLAGGITALCCKLSTGNFPWALACLALATAALVILDAAAGGALARFSTLGYNPASGTRFYGVGNEYAAILAGGLTMGLTVLAHQRRLSAAPLAVVGGIAVLVLGLPTMGADVGGSLALGLGVGAILGLIRRDRPRDVILWAVGGFAFATVLFLASGSLFPDVSHGSRVAGGGGGMYEILVRKLAISLDYLLNPILLLLLATGAAMIYTGWLRARGSSLAVGMTGAVVAAAASGALNDSGLVAALFALIYPIVGALGVLISKDNAAPRRSS